MASSALFSKIRKDLNLNDLNQFSNEDLDKVVEEAKSILRREFGIRYNEGYTFNRKNGKCTDYALEQYSKLLIAADNPPKSISQLRRTNFEDTELNYLKDNIIRNVRKVCDN